MLSLRWQCLVTRHNYIDCVRTSSDYAALAICSLFSQRVTILSASSANSPLKPFALFHGEHIQTSRSSALVQGLGWKHIGYRQRALFIGF